MKAIVYEKYGPRMFLSSIRTHGMANIPVFAQW
jgi:hypothetical protein